MHESNYRIGILPIHLRAGGGSFPQQELSVAK